MQIKCLIIAYDAQQMGIPKWAVGKQYGPARCADERSNLGRKCHKDLPSGPTKSPQTDEKWEYRAPPNVILLRSNAPLLKMATHLPVTTRFKGT